ncbi:MAG: hypothetical protein NT062_17255 [Proteobacteria bacterium]|nr:hypothetical protein [Pseudomonadota bacterium]
MGYAYSVYSVDLKKLRPHGKKLFAELRATFADDLAEADEWFDTAIIEKGAPTRLRALYQLMMKLPLQKDAGFQYGYCVEMLCKHFGERVDDVSLTWFSDVLDPLLKQARCPKTDALLGAGVFPMKIPKPSDFPEIGTVTPAKCKVGARAMSLVKPLTDGDENLDMVVDEVRRWFDAGLANKRGLVWFVY